MSTSVFRGDYPSKRAISGWLALFNDDIFQAVRENEPELLLDEGDPASLTLNQRKQALRAYVERYGKGGWRGLQTPYIQIERFADPELADEISQLWEQGVENPEVRRTLLSLIEQGSISGCADIAYCIACKPALLPKSTIETPFPPALSDGYTRGLLIGRPRAFSLFMAQT